MKTLIEFCSKNGLTLTPIKYRHQFGYCKRKGYDITRGQKIIASFEPCEFSNGEKWYLRNTHENCTGPRYFKRITPKSLENLNPAANSFFINSSVNN